MSDPIRDTLIFALLKALKALVEATEQADNPSDMGVSSGDEVMITAREVIEDVETVLNG